VITRKMEVGVTKEEDSMKLLSKISMVLLVMAMMVFAGCDQPNNGGGGGGSGSNLTVDFTNHQGANAAFRVRNETNVRLVAFRNSADPSNLLGGIPAGAQNHGLRAVGTLQATAFPVVLVTEEQFANGNFAAMNSNPFSRIFVFVNPNAEPEAPTEVYSISGNLGGDLRLRLENPTNHNWEVRLGGHRGPTLGYITSGMTAIELRVQSGEYEFFPVIRTFNPVLGRLNTVYPRNAAGHPWSFGQHLSNPASLYVLNVNNAYQQTNAQGITLGVAWLVINNQNLGGAVRMMEGGQARTNQVGISMINAAQTRTFHVEMPSIGTNVFQDHLMVSTLQVSAGGIHVPLRTPGGETNIRLGLDHMYTINITGDHNIPQGSPGALQAIIDIDNARAITLADF